MSSSVLRLGGLAGLAGLLLVTVAVAQQRAAGGPAAGAAGSSGAMEDHSVAVFNPIDGRIRVLSARRDGDRVEKGEVVCTLDRAGLEDRVAIEEAEVHAARVGAQAARLAREAAALELNEYKENRFVVDLAEADGEIKLAETNLMRAEDQLEWARRMFDKGYVSMAEKIKAELSFKKAQFDLEKAQAHKVLLVRRTRERTTRSLMAEVEAARERELTKEAALKRAELELKSLHDQIGLCQVAAPVAGRVHYDAPIGAGAVAQDGRVLFRIVPDERPAQTRE